MILFYMLLVYGWMLLAYLRYRQGRQDEVVHVLSTAVETDTPLGPALWAYLRDRPRGWLREFWVAVLLFFVVPGYYWIWHRRHSYDQKIASVAHQLEHGVSLPLALKRTPGAASRETILAVAVGESTGLLAQCLRNSVRARLATVWQETLPRLIYPLLLLLLLCSVTAFWMASIAPRLVRIFADQDLELPELTWQLIDLWQPVVRGLVLGLLGLAALVVLLLVSSDLRWHFPGSGRFYRMRVQSQALSMLGFLLDTGKPVPESLDLLASSGYFARAASRRLGAVRHLVEQGEPLADSLRRKGLLPSAMSPLVEAAQRAQNLPWALAELGDVRAKRRARELRRISLVLFPVSVVMVGLMVGFSVLAMFMPIVELMTRLSQ